MYSQFGMQLKAYLKCTRTTHEPHTNTCVHVCVPTLSLWLGLSQPLYEALTQGPSLRRRVSQGKGGVVTGFSGSSNESMLLTVAARLFRGIN